MKRSIVFVLTLVLCFMVNVSTLTADDHSKNEVIKLIKKVEKKLDKYNEAGADKYAGKELVKIENYIKKSKSFLDESDYDEAYYEVGKADAYFKLIELSIA